MRGQHMKVRSDELLRSASGEELLLLSIFSNPAMRRQIQQELERRSGGVRQVRDAANVSLHLRRAA